MSTTTSVVSATQFPRPKFTIEQLNAAWWSCVEMNETHTSIEAGFTPELEEDMHLYVPPESTVAGYAAIEALINGFMARIDFTWQAHGKDDGTFEGLYNFSMALEEQNDFSIKVNFDLVDEDGDIIKVSTCSSEIGEFINELSNDVWVNEALGTCPSMPDAEQVDQTNTTGEQMEHFKRIEAAIKEFADVGAHNYSLEAIAEKLGDAKVEDEQIVFSDEAYVPMVLQNGAWTFRAWQIKRDNATDLEFVGVKIAFVSSSSNNASGNYSGSTGRHQKLRLYKTRGGKFVCEKIDVTQWQGENNRHFAEVCTTEQEIIAFFGQKWLAKDLYYNAGIKNVTVID